MKENSIERISFYMFSILLKVKQQETVTSLFLLTLNESELQTVYYSVETGDGFEIFGRNQT